MPDQVRPKPQPQALDLFLREQGRALRAADRPPASREAWQQRRTALRQAMLAAMGPGPEKPCPLNARVLGVLKRQGYLIEKLPYDPLRDFAPISLTHRQPNILVVHPSLPVKSVRELIALAKARPAELNYASSGLGSTNHLAGELFKVMTGVKIVRINYKGVGPAVTAVLSGEVQLMYANLASVSHYLQSGRLRPLAITSAEPSPLRPGLPTMAA